MPTTTDFVHAPALQALWTWTRAQPWAEAELRTAMADFAAASGPANDPAAQQQVELRFVDWFHLDRPVPRLGATPVALWLAATGEVDSPLARSVVGAFRVTRVVPHSQVVLTALGSGEAHRIKDKALSVRVAKGQLAFGRLYPHAGGFVTGTPLLAVDEAVATAIRPAGELAVIADGLALERALFGVG